MNIHAQEDVVDNQGLRRLE